MSKKSIAISLLFCLALVLVGRSLLDFSPDKQTAMVFGVLLGVLYEVASRKLLAS